MKKVFLSLLVVMLALVSVYADGTAYNAYSKWDTDKVLEKSERFSTMAEVYLDTTGTYQAEIGLTQDSATGASETTFYSFTQNNFRPINAGDNSIKLEVNRTNGYASLPNETPVHATWLIQSGQNLSVFLLASGAMQNKTFEGSSINWVVVDANNSQYKYIDTSNNTNVNTPDNTDQPINSLYVYEHNPSKAFKNYGSVKLLISTSDSVWSKPAGNYEANLYLVLVNEG